MPRLTEADRFTMVKEFGACRAIDIADLDAKTVTLDVERFHAMAGSVSALVKSLNAAEAEVEALKTENERTAFQLEAALGRYV